MNKEIILTGDRPTGPLHVGHYIGSLANRVKLQDDYKEYIMVADVQALTDNFSHPEKIRDNIVEVVCDYLAVGIDPTKATIFLQSMIRAIPELTMYYMNLVTVARVSRNPTVKTEIKQKGFGESLPVGFFVYPINQAADITAFKATLVPVGEDQLPMVEQSNEIVRAFNRIYGKEVLREAKGLVPACSRLVGIDGQAKMSKSLNNAIYLKDTPEERWAKIKTMYTDPHHLRVEDPGKVEGNTVFTYLDVFGTDKEKIAQLKAHYQRGGLGDMVVKKYLAEVLDAYFTPIAQRRAEYAADKAQILKILATGTKHAIEVADATLNEVRDVMKLLHV